MCQSKTKSWQSFRFTVFENNMVLFSLSCSASVLDSFSSVMVQNIYTAFIEWIKWMCRVNRNTTLLFQVLIRWMATACVCIDKTQPPNGSQASLHTTTSSVETWSLWMTRCSIHTHIHSQFLQYIRLVLLQSKGNLMCVQVLEPQNVDPSMVQMTFLDDVVHSLLKGENIGITSRRRSRSSQNNNSAHVSTVRRTTAKTSWQ